MIFLQDLSALRSDLVLGLAEATLVFFWADEGLKSRHHSLDHVMRVIRTQALGQDVVDPSSLKDRADRSTGDHARTHRSGLEQDLTGAKAPDDLVRDGVIDDGHRHHVATSGLIGLADRFGDLIGLTVSDTDLALPITDDGDGAKAKAATALDDLGDTIDRDDRLMLLALFSL